MRNAETRVQRSSGRLVAILVAALVGSAAAAFGIAKLVRSTKSQPEVPQIAAASDAPPPDAPPDTPRAEVPADAVVTPIADAAPPPPADAKKGATSSQPAHPAKYGSLDVTAFPVLTVYVDNRRIGDTPQSLKLPVGKHVIRLKNEERDERVPITITENKTTKIDRTK